MQELTAEQKIRERLAGSPFEDPHFQHEGEEVIRWITGGSLPDVYVTFHPEPEGEQIAVKCAVCKNVLGYLPANRDADQTAKALIEIRQSGHEHKASVS